MKLIKFLAFALLATYAVESANAQIFHRKHHRVVRHHHHSRHHRM